ncbi:helix-turn-helix transcriptional regulator [Pelosinus propionicus]|uniref:Predicted transcriptional regulator YheO, contains PAS and DNA-binding HTH domains n=1 Tax=Pelosinus propionicus DSM 13327 TaxID=1123291 RepID=A0A1I4NHA6_9FIRM|nr:PAS domain-containing protein [Pelosinus propionicus]SFM14677.1 Predicted transcriptional regulator YheO, contains PAS and DNA-binding HTH domains [Pelosinus propionicus DSM 13327]
MKELVQWKNYIDLVKFLGKCLGDNAEIVLHDLTDNEHSIIAIENSHVTDRTIGAPITMFALNKLKEMEHTDQSSILNYKGTSRKGVPLRSSSFIIRDTQDRPIGMLCINIDISDYIRAEETLKKLSFIPELHTIKKPLHDLHENFPNSVSDLVSDAIKEVLGDETITPSKRLSIAEKIKIVDHLSKKGLFLVKGAISEVATQLATSEVTIYRYINKISKHGKKS